MGRLVKSGWCASVLSPVYCRLWWCCCRASRVCRQGEDERRVAGAACAASCGLLGSVQISCGGCDLGAPEGQCPTVFQHLWSSGYDVSLTR